MFKLLLILFVIDDNDILMYSTHNEGTSIVAGRFIRTLKCKIYNKLTANTSKSYLFNLNKLEGKCLSLLSFYF